MNALRHIDKPYDVCPLKNSAIRRTLLPDRQIVSSAAEELCHFPLKSWLQLPLKISMIVACEAVIAHSHRYADLAEHTAQTETDAANKAELLEIAEICRRVPEFPARNFREAIQSFWFIHLCIETEQMACACSPGRYGQYMYPFYKKDIEEGNMVEKFGVEGKINLLLLLGIVLAVFLSGLYPMGELISVNGIAMEGQNLLRDGLLLCIAGLSLKLTSRRTREGNGFSWGPIEEVAKLFFGIFISMIPVIAILRAGPDGAFAPLVRLVSHDGQPINSMRRDRRIDWYPEYSKASGVMRIDQIPATRHDLRELIQNHYHLAALRSQIINISAAGACALLPDAPELKSLSADHGLMLYIISDGINLADATYVFLCKKIGITSSDAVDTLKLRMQFTHELNLRNSNSSLSWSEIANTGSSRLNRFIQDICCDEKESSYPEQI